MTTRRQFLSAGAAMSVLSLTQSRAGTTSSSPYPINEFEARIARKDFRDMTKDILPTPCMVVDLDMFNANVKHMAETAKATGVNVRPHVKVHKSVDVAISQDYCKYEVSISRARVWHPAGPECHPRARVSDNASRRGNPRQSSGTPRRV